MIIALILLSCSGAALGMSDAEVNELNARLDLFRATAASTLPHRARTPWMLYGRAYVLNFQGPLPTLPAYTFRFPSRRLSVGLKRDFDGTAVDLRLTREPDGTFKASFTLYHPL